MEISKDTLGCFAKINAIYSDGEIIIRWGLDYLTYTNIKRAISTRPFSVMPNLEYKYRLLDFGFSNNSNGSKDYFGTVECILEKQTKTIEFKCSENFAGNIKWMKEVNSIDELEHIKWVK